MICTFVMMIHISANALLRAFLNLPIPNTLEIVQYWYLPLVAFLGFVAAQYRGQHIATDLIYQRLPQASRRYVLALVFAACSALSAAFAWFVWGEAVHAMEIGKTAGVSDVIAWPAYFLAPLAFGSLTVQFAVAAVRAVTRPGEDGHLVGDPEDAVLEAQMAADGMERR